MKVTLTPAQLVALDSIPHDTDVREVVIEQDSPTEQAIEVTLGKHSYGIMHDGYIVDIT